MASTTLSSTGVVTLSNIGKEPLSDSLAIGAQLTAKQTNNGITYLFTATEQTIRNVREVFGEVSITKPARFDLAALEGTLTYNLNKQALSANLIGNKQVKGTDVELNANWAELSGQWDLGASVSPHPNHKLAATYNPHTQASVLNYTLDWRGWSVEPALNVQKRAPGIAVSKVLPEARGTLKATHALQDGATTLSWSRDPATVQLATKFRDGKFAPPSLSLSLEQDLSSALNRLSTRTSPSTSDSDPTGTVDKPAKPADKYSRPVETPAKLSSVGVVTLKNVGKGSIEDNLGVGVKLTAKKTANDITYLFTATEQTIHNLKSIFGELSITKPARLDFCTLEGTLAYNLAKQALSTTLIANKKSRGREVELKAAWAESNGQWNLGASVKPHAGHKLVATLNPHTKASVATYTLDWRGWTIQPALNVQKQAPALAVSKKLPQARGTVKATHALQDGNTTLSWTRKPGTVGLSTKLRDGEFSPPTLTLTLEQDFTDIPNSLNPRRRDTPKSTEAVDTSTAPVDAKAAALEEKLSRPVGKGGDAPQPPKSAQPVDTSTDDVDRRAAELEAKLSRPIWAGARARRE